MSGVGARRGGMDDLSYSVAYMFRDIYCILYYLYRAKRLYTSTGGSHAAAPQNLHKLADVRR
jgi:hypothetical protein